MNIQTIKTNVKEAFASVESQNFLQLKIDNSLVAHRQSFAEFQYVFPGKDFNDYKKLAEDVNVNCTNNEEMMAIGIYLLALEELEKEILQTVENGE